jgi:threonine dehydrogenase-like Zn-dependent dehydrogenase
MEHYLDLVRTRRVDGTPILTHRFPLGRWQDAFLACGDQGRSGAVKVLFEFSADGGPGAGRG